MLLDLLSSKTYKNWCQKSWVFAHQDLTAPNPMHAVPRLIGGLNAKLGNEKVIMVK